MLEVIAVLLAIAYLLLAAREHIWCWYCAFISSAMFTLIFWDVSLLMDSMLNIFYVVMAVVGWQQWRYGGKENTGLEIRTMKPLHHVLLISAVLLVTLVNGWYMNNYTTAVWPYVDAFTTWASVLTTFMVVYKILENWIYWFVIDLVAIYLYIDRELYLTALLFFAYVIIVVFGFFSWRRIMADKKRQAAQ